MTNEKIKPPKKKKQTTSKPSKTSTLVTLPHGIRKSLETILDETQKRYTRYHYNGYLGHVENVREWLEGQK